VAGDGVRSLVHCMPWYVLSSLFSYGLCLACTPPVSSPSNSRLGTGAVATATAADCAPQHAPGWLSAGAKLLIWVGVTQLWHWTRRVSLVMLSLWPRTGLEFCRRVFVLLSFAAAGGHGTMVLSVGWPSFFLLPSTGKSFFVLIGSCSLVCYSVLFASPTCVFLHFCIVAVVVLLCSIKRSLPVSGIHFATEERYLRKRV